MLIEGVLMSLKYREGLFPASRGNRARSSYPHLKPLSASFEVYNGMEAESTQWGVGLIEPISLDVRP